MGDRAVIGVTHPTSDTTIYLYTHWEGYRICETLAVGLDTASAMGRLTDYEYATRIIFDTLTGCTGGATGFGISIGSHPFDVQYDIPYVRWDERGEPSVEYQGRTKSVRDFIAYFLPDKAESEA
jgi:hypothetical protein